MPLRSVPRPRASIRLHRRADFVSAAHVDGEDGPDTILVDDSGEDDPNTGNFEGPPSPGWTCRLGYLCLGRHHRNSTRGRR